MKLKRTYKSDKENGKNILLSHDNRMWIDKNEDVIKIHVSGFLAVV